MEKVTVQAIRQVQGWERSELTIATGRYETTRFRYGESKTFNMNTGKNGNVPAIDHLSPLYPDEFYSYTSELQEQIAEGKIDGIIIIRKVEAPS